MQHTGPHHHHHHHPTPPPTSSLLLPPLPSHTHHTPAAMLQHRHRDHTGRTHRLRDFFLQQHPAAVELVPTDIDTQLPDNNETSSRSASVMVARTPRSIHLTTHLGGSPAPPTSTSSTRASMLSTEDLECRAINRSGCLPTHMSVISCGTHVAASDGGAQCGVAKRVTIHCMQVTTPDGQGSFAGILNAMSPLCPVPSLHQFQFAITLRNLSVLICRSGWEARASA